MMSRFLQWRRDNNVDKIRQDIVEGGMDHPLKFPNGEKILGLIPQLVITPDAFDKMGAPICVDQYCFSPEEVLNKISIQEYIVFVMHCLEYRSLVVDQLSEQREREFLASHTKEELAALQDPDSESTYGVLLNTCVIRDLGAVGFEHVSSQGQEIIRAVVGLSTENYPELMRKCFMINTPWVFNALWYFIKGLLAARFVYSPSDDDDDDIFPRPNTHTHTHARSLRTLAKISIMGTDFRQELEKDIDKEYIPSLIGGPYKGGMEYKPFAWDKGYLCMQATDAAPAPPIPEVRLQAPSSAKKLTSVGDSEGPRERLSGAAEAMRINRSALDDGNSGDDKQPKQGGVVPPLARMCPFVFSLGSPTRNNRRAIKALAVATPIPFGQASGAVRATVVAEDPTPLALTGWL